jgi:hypothetical protein
MSLEMKYFVLKPEGKDPFNAYAAAARLAIDKFADFIEPTDPELAKDLREWMDKIRRSF